MDFKIVVAEDEQAIASAIAYALRREGYTVETATGGEEALSKTESFQPHVLVLDVMMPKMSGFGPRSAQIINTSSEYTSAEGERSSVLGWHRRTGQAHVRRWIR